jgi:hypothetical protein
MIRERELRTIPGIPMLIAAMVSNLLVVLCGERSTQPVVNTGTIYQWSGLMSDRKPFLLRLDKRTLEALQRWAGDDLRSLNAQIEYLLRTALKEAGGLPKQNEGQEKKRG